MTIQDEKHHIGIDVSKAILDVYILPCKKYMQFRNEPKDIGKLIKKLQTFSSASVIMEATGGYEKPVAQGLQQAGMNVSVVNPRQIRDFAKSLGKLAKTDRIDAQVIALFSEKIEPRASTVIGKTQQDLSALNARRRQIIDMLIMEKNRLDKTNPRMKKSILRIIKVLEKELESINDELEQVIQTDAEFAKRSVLLRSIKGIGPASAAGILAELPELGNTEAKQISALAGLAPFNRDSGTKRGQRTIWGGRASVRCALYMATLVATRHNPQIREFYTRLCNAGKKKKVALTACMHKLLIIMNAMLKHGETWRAPVIVTGV